ncbi:response regulator transcription factor [Sporichthya sp.]|uniref:response regulator transcription factor n=1 Tax=Sporichthya sp. TaxID=65475 RepID=UPI00184C9203|nr:response regulator transcription factor [Sporichthya sp.]MBA3741715.1 response regulator transcription factor [Sporichthya sp.]
MFKQLCPETERLDPLQLRATFCRVQVLIVDDSALVRRLITAQLEGTGRFDLVMTAGDGNEAIGLAELMQPDVVLLDLSMPFLGGLEALPLVLSVAPHARVIVMSGSPSDEMAVRALAAGAVGYLDKGPQLHLPAVIDAVLGAA